MCGTVRWCPKCRKDLLRFQKVRPRHSLEIRFPFDCFDCPKTNRDSKPVQSSSCWNIETSLETCTGESQRPAATDLRFQLYLSRSVEMMRKKWREGATVTHNECLIVVFHLLGQLIAHRLAKRPLVDDFNACVVGSPFLVQARDNERLRHCTKVSTPSHT